MPRFVLRIVQIFLISLVLVLAGCDEAEVDSTGRLVSLTTEPSQLQLAQGTSGQLKAVGIYEDGSTRELTQSVLWSQEGPSLKLFQVGQVAGISPGTGQVKVSLDGFTASVPVTVTDATLTGLQMEGAEGTLEPGVSTPLLVAGFFSDGTQQELTGQATLTVEGPAELTREGEIRGFDGGQAIVTAAFMDQTTLHSVRLAAVRTVSRVAVTPANTSFPKGITSQLKATAYYSDGTSADVTNSASWSSTAPTVCTTTTKGLLTGVKAGTSTIRATFSGKVGSAAVTINTATLGSLTITSAGSLVAGTTKQLKVTARYSNNATYDMTNAASFRSGTASVASVTSTGTSRGLIKGLAQGSSVITGSFGGKSVTTTVTVTAPTITGFSLSPTSATLPAGTTRQLTATATFSDGTSRTVTNETSFTSNATSVATVSTLNPRGVVTGRVAGTARITATYSGRQATSSITVSAATLSSIRFEPGAASIAAGTTQSFLVRALYSDASQRDVTSQAVITVQSPTVAQLQPTAGLVRGLSPGSTGLSASFGGRTAAASLTVTPAVLTRIDVTPGDAGFPKGTQQQFVATGVYSNSTTQNLTSTVAWTAAESSVIDIGDGGLAFGAEVGQTRITATLGDKSGSVNAKVTAAVLTGLTVQPALASVPKGLTQALTASAIFSDGTSRDVTADAMFASEAPQVAEVSNGEGRGTVTALAEGSTSVTASYGGKQARSAITVTGAVVNAIRFEPATASIPSGTTQSFLVRALMSDGTQRDVTSESAITVEDPAVGSSTGTAGEIQGATPGQTRVNASFHSKTASAQLTVTPAVLTRIDVTPASSSLPKGTSQALTATGLFSDQTTRDLTSDVSWSAEQPEVCSISGAGQIQALQIGSTNVRATLNGISGQASVEVSGAVLTGLTLEPPTASVPKGLTQTLTATAIFSDGTSLDVTGDATFTSEAPQVASVSNGEGGGTVTALAEGAASLTASYGGQQARFTVTVTAAVVNSLRFEPATASIPSGTNQSFLVRALMSDGTQRDVTSDSAISAEDPAVASPTATAGEIHGATPGQTRVNASFHSKTAFAELTVTPAVLTRIDVTPASSSLPKGTSQVLIATGVFSDGTTQDVTSEASWTAEQPEVCSVVGGQVQALQVGSTSVRATLNGVSGQASVEVSAAALVKIELYPPTGSLPSGRTQQLTATATFTDGTSLEVTSDTTFSSSSPDTLSVSNAGVATARGIGQATLTAAYEGQSATATLTVTGAVLESLTVEPPTLSVPKGLLGQLSASGAYSDGMTRDLTSEVLWTSLAPSVAEVNASGGVSALGQGPATIQAELDGQQAQSSVTVIAPSLLSLSITPKDLHLALLGTAQLAVVAKYSDATELDVTSQATWESLNTSVVRVSSSGLATARHKGSAAVRATWGEKTVSETITVERRGTGEGWFPGYRTGTENGFGSWAMELADLDGDGWTDGVSIDASSNMIRIQFNGQEGLLTRTGDFAASSSPNSRLSAVKVADFDGDQDTDLVVSDTYDRSFRVFLNDGQGGFTAGAHFSLRNAGYPSNLMVGDFDQDADIDIMVNDPTPGTLSLAVFRNNGSASFAAQMDSTFSSGPPWLPFVYDFDGVNGLDLVYVDRTASDVVLVANNGNGTFREPQVLIDNVNASATVVADWNGDGQPDLATSASSGSDNVTVWLNNGADQFSQSQQFPGGNGNILQSAQDVNGDGHPDLIWSPQNWPQTFLAVGRGDGTFEAPLELWAPTRSLRVADLNHDGIQDIVAMIGGFVHYFFDENGTTPQVSYLMFDSYTTEQYDVGDFDRDGDLDFAVLNAQDPLANRLIRNDGQGRLTQSGTFRTASNPKSVVLADVNRDGKLDLVTSGYAINAQPALSVLMGRGDGTFATKVDYHPSTTYPGKFVAGDFDGDGDLDMAATDFAGNAIKIYRNDGLGRFGAAPLIIAAGSGPGQVTAADVDGDGDLDLLASSQGEYRVMVLKNNGSGSFAAPLNYNTGFASPGLIAAADIDGDDDLDLAVTHGVRTTVVMENDGTGSFTAKSSFPEYPTLPLFGDFDGDGDQDLVTGSLRFNDGMGQFGPPFSGGGGGRHRVAGDFDGDGDLDISLLTEWKQFYDCISIWPNNPSPRTGPAG